jgi:hypothetical protein
MSDVEFEEQNDNMDLPKRPIWPVNGFFAKKLVDKKVAPSGMHANWILISISIFCFTVALILFALFLQTPAK